MPAPNKKNIIEWFGSYLSHEGLPVEQTAAEMAKKIKETRDPDKVLDYVDKILRAHGIESIRGEYHVDNYYFDIVALYVNMGDTYSATLLYETDKRRFLLTTWGDWVERNQKKYGIV